ncbi:DUF222 domain-containing protein [Ornithinimicrobium sp. Y1847]|uniref:HNH endonuclease n=2 Tax=Ornithinimicrobium sp. Y1847 TaxID=3405419 RepID=UPI003CFE640D
MSTITDEVRTWATTLIGADLTGLSDDDRLELLRSLEDLSRSVAGVGARVQVAFADSQWDAQKEAGVPVRRRAQAVADDLATARKTSPYWGSRDLTTAKALVAELPKTLAALESGVINGYQARIISEATTTLDPQDRAQVDTRLAPELAGMSTREISAAVAALVYELDPAGFVNRARKAAQDRGVSIRPTPDVMSLLSARLPAPMGIAAYNALQQHAVTARASGDPRTVNQLMADEVFARLTGRTIVDGIDVEIGLVMSDTALFAGDSDPADLIGYGPIPAPLARDLLRPHDLQAPDQPDQEPAEPGQAPDQPGQEPAEPGEDAAPPPPRAAAGEAAGVCPDGARCTSFDCALLHGHLPTNTPSPLPEPGPEPEPQPKSKSDLGPEHEPPGGSGSGGSGGASVVKVARAWVRRLYTDPVTGTLVCRDPRKRFFTGAARAFIIARDRTCRTPWCGAPIRDIDHLIPHSEGGTSTVQDGQGLCQRCNLARHRDRQNTPQASDYRGPGVLLDTHLGRPPHTAQTPHRTVENPDHSVTSSDQCAKSSDHSGHRPTARSDTSRRSTHHSSDSDDEPASA